MADLPEISQNLDDPLPQVDPNSDLVPYRMSRTDPGQAPVVTTGYGPRGRPPIQPPESFGGGVGMPSLDQIYQAAFSKLPVEEAVQATNAATKYVGQRMLAKALSAARTPEDMTRAYGQFGYLAFGNGQAVPEILRATVQQQKMNAPTIHGAGGGLYRVPTAGPAETLVAPQPKPPVRPPASVELVDAIQKANQDIQDAEKRGDKAAADKARERSELLQSQAKGGISMEFGPGGTLQSFSTGGGNKQKPTIAMATQAQEKLVKYKNSIDLMNRLEAVLKPEHVGVRGSAGEVFVDKGLQQAAEAFGLPDVASKDRIEARKLMIALREGLMREMNDGSRFSLADREEISKALPSSGIFESGRDAKEALGVVRRVLTQRSQNYAKSIGKSTPLWTLSKEQVKATFPKAEDLIAAAKSGKVDKQEAEDALTEYY